MKTAHLLALSLLFTLIVLTWGINRFWVNSRLNNNPIAEFDTLAIVQSAVNAQKVDEAFKKHYSSISTVWVIRDPWMRSKLNHLTKLGRKATFISDKAFAAAQLSSANVTHFVMRISEPTYSSTDGAVRFFIRFENSALLIQYVFKQKNNAWQLTNTTSLFC
jgi:hypothetical protein